MEWPPRKADSRQVIYVGNALDLDLVGHSMPPADMMTTLFASLPLTAIKSRQSA
jgi:hypothetical protein